MDARKGTKPAAPRTAEQLVDYALAQLPNEDFSILCPDNEVTAEVDAQRIRWSTDDMLQSRPALSWSHPAWKDCFADWVKRPVDKGEAS
jgi:hypothetical protein